MTQIDLRPFGFTCEVEVHGKIEKTYRGGRRLLFLFGENHRDREMKRLNVLNACALLNAGVVGCVATEDPLVELDMLTSEEIQTRSSQLFEEHKTDEAVIDYLNHHQPFWFGIFQFGNTLKVLRPSVAVRCVEDPRLREEMKPISDDYCIWDLGGGPHPSPDYPHMDDHPHNLKRERAMIDNTLTFWEETAPSRAAILNTGSAHSERIAAGLQERDISYIHIQVP